MFIMAKHMSGMRTSAAPADNRLNLVLRLD